MLLEHQSTLNIVMPSLFCRNVMQAPNQRKYLRLQSWDGHQEQEIRPFHTMRKYIIYLTNLIRRDRLKTCNFFRSVVVDSATLLYILRGYAFLLLVASFITESASISSYSIINYGISPYVTKNIYGHIKQKCPCGCICGAYV